MGRFDVTVSRIGGQFSAKGVVGSIVAIVLSAVAILVTSYLLATWHTDV